MEQLLTPLELHWKRELTGNPLLPLVMGRTMCVRQVAPFQATPGEVGVACVVVFRSNFDTPALVLVHDYGFENTGVCATNAMHDILTSIVDTLAFRSALMACPIIQHNSMGYYDNITSHWTPVSTNSMRCVDVAWSPLKWGALDPRSLATFLAWHGDASRIANVMVETLRQTAHS